MVRQWVVLIGTAFIAALIAAAPVHAGGFGCVGDCDGDGTVSIGELVRAVNIALGSAALDTCPAIDLNGNGSADINELVAAVNNALNSCPSGGETPTTPPDETPTTPGGATATPTPTSNTPTSTVPTDMSPTPTPTTSDVTPIPGAAGAAVAGSTTAMVNAVGLLSNIIAAIITGVDLGSAAQVHGALSDGVGGAASACPLGGDVTQSGPFPVNVMITLTDCKVPTPDGAVTFNGTIGLMFFNFTLSIDMVFEDMGGNQTQTATAQLAGMVAPTLSDTCFVSSATLAISQGLLSVTQASGGTASIAFMSTTILIDNLVFNDACVPQSYRLTFNGPAALQAAHGEPASVLFRELKVDVDATSEPASFQINGGMDSPCFGGTTTISTASPLTVARDEICPRAGEVLATVPSGNVRIFYRSTQAVEIDEGDNGSIELSAPNCLDPRLLVCLG